MQSTNNWPAISASWVLGKGALPGRPAVWGAGTLRGGAGGQATGCCTPQKSLFDLGRDIKRN